MRGGTCAKNNVEVAVTGGGVGTGLLRGLADTVVKKGHLLLHQLAEPDADLGQRHRRRLLA